MRALSPVPFSLFRFMRFWRFVFLLFLAGCQTTGLELDPRLAKALGQPLGSAQTANDKKNTDKAVVPPMSQGPSPEAVQEEARRNAALAEVNSILEARRKQKKISPEDLLDAEGNMNVVEQTAEYDPAAEHLKARSSVDTGRKVKVAELSPKFDVHTDDQSDKTFRVVKMAEGDKRIQEPVEEGPKQVASVDPSVKETPQIEGRAEDGFTVVVPGRKPVFEVVKPQEVQVADAAIAPGRKPLSSVESIEDVADIEPAAGSSDIPPVLPKRKPVQSVSDPAFLKPAIVTDSPKKAPKKPSFMPVKLQPLGLEAQAELLSSGGDEILKMRSGENAGRTRIVFDVRGEARFEASMDSSKNLVSVEFQGAKWSAGDGPEFNMLSVVRAAHVETLPGGVVRISLELKKESKILAATALDSDKPGMKRVVIDLRNNS